MQQRVTTLSNENRSLRQQLQQLQQIVSRMTGSSSVATTGTVLMVLALSFSMFVNPSSTQLPQSNISSSRTLKSVEGVRAMPHVASVPPALSPTVREMLFGWLGVPRANEDNEEYVAMEAVDSSSPMASGDSDREDEESQGEFTVPESHGMHRAPVPVAAGGPGCSPES